MISKFETAEEKERKAQRNKKIMSFFVIGVLLFSVLAYSLISLSDNDSNSENYNKFKFARTVDGWQTKIDDFFIITQYYPLEVEKITYTGTINKENFENIVYFVAGNDNEKTAAEEINKNLIALKKDYACLPDVSSENCINITRKSCADASYIQQIVIFEQGQNASLNYNANCLVIKGNDREELIMAADKAIFLIQGVMK